MVPVETAEEALEVALMARGGFVVASLELGVPDVGLAMFAPVFGLFLLFSRANIVLGVIQARVVAHG